MYERNVAVLRRAEAERTGLAEGGGHLDEHIGIVKLLQAGLEKTQVFL